jgi:ATP-dependent RNA helicase RhlE
MTFSNLGLSQPLLTAVADNGYTEPTAIQSATIEAVLAGKDMMATAQTGTGKTAAFTLPILEKLSQLNDTGNHPRALIVTPTRELAAQVHASVETYGRHLNLRSLAIFGGVKIGPQIKRLRQGIDILVATPGRLLDLQNQRAVNLSNIEILVLDEADRMLDMGFIPDIKRILSHLPATKQTVMFSATFSSSIRELARQFLKHPVEVDVTPKNAAAKTVTQLVHPVDKKRKSALLQHLFQEKGWSQALVFTRTKHGANKLTKDLSKANIKAAAIHGNKSQAQRTKALDDFKRGKVALLIATDIASRGIDINELPMVVNFDLPNVPEDYVHRIGRTGRAGQEGHAISLVSADEIKQLQQIERVIQVQLDREVLEGFEPENALPTTRQASQGKSASPSRSRNSNHRDSGKRQQNRNSRNDSNRSQSNRSENNRSDSNRSQSNRSENSRSVSNRSESNPGNSNRGQSSVADGNRAPSSRSDNANTQDNEVNGNRADGNRSDNSHSDRSRAPQRKPRTRNVRASA